MSSLRETQYYANNLEASSAAREQELEANYQKFAAWSKKKPWSMNANAYA
ncbi:hypothetical protein [Thiothrix fructosivorans]|uniref:Uncharacterized protein n=1 Tax=Thiothrix fructosivorans TaxID=111770 RepID=A0ABS3ILA5_9GAMM|nr:hypothetical protein [Thiothrix fructosivorans]MBO0613805.1 hypothetical protein [Thiothrix fructosivorans]